jgi:hypothetical protein
MKSLSCKNKEYGFHECGSFVSPSLNEKRLGRVVYEVKVFLGGKSRLRRVNIPTGSLVLRKFATMDVHPSRI